MLTQIFKLLALPFIFPFFVATSFAQIWRANFANEKRFEKLMERSGRKRTAETVDLTQGTLILERPSYSWAKTRLWWSPDEILALSPYPYPSPEERRKQATSESWDPFDRWCTETYLDAKNGTACLISAGVGQELLEGMRKKRLGLHFVVCESAGKEWEQLFNACASVSTQKVDASDGPH
jgi:hypothetical protein